MTIRENEPLLICELGLHGDGSIQYYLQAIDAIRDWWTGWPPIGIKTQAWSLEGEFAQRMQERQGRLPLACLPDFDHRQLMAACREAGFAYGITFHDPQAVPEWAGELDFVKCKLVTAREVWQAVIPVAKRIVATSGGAAFISPANVWRRMRGWWGCPNNERYRSPNSGDPRGYSCHAVPELAMVYAADAARGWWENQADALEGDVWHPPANTIEVHVSHRSLHRRPLPADMCVSLSLAQFKELATTIGTTWSR